MHLPQIIYGTAWKGVATSDCVMAAVAAGFSALDTANFPKHYNEALVGEALVALNKKGVRREQLFIQTKFTPARAQDANIPYDPHADLAEQVMTSFNSSLAHLHTDYLDAYLLHAPASWPDLVADDWAAWQALEDLYQSGRVHRIGVSNFNRVQLAALTQQASIKPMIIQNRCFAEQDWDHDVRAWCQQHSIQYQGFSLLTANPQVLQHPQLINIAQRLQKTPEQIIFRFSQQLGITPLTGTTSEAHMKADLALADFELTADEISDIKKCK